MLEGSLMGRSPDAQAECLMLDEGLMVDETDGLGPDAGAGLMLD